MSQAPGGSEPGPELIVRPGGGGPQTGDGLDHLVVHRRLIVRRSLLATAVGGVVPLPVMDEYLAGRVKAGLLMKIAERRQVDLLQSSAELLGDPREGTAVRNATLTAITLFALKMAWRKFFALLEIGRRAEDMATTFQLGTLFDHFCAKMHVGSGIDRARAVQLRAVIHASLAETERAALVSAFRDGSRVLGRTLLEAPAWATAQLERASRHWAESGGTTTEGSEAGADGGTDAPPGPGAGPDAASMGTPDPNEGAAGDPRWVDRAARVVEGRLSLLGQGYLNALIRNFERRWQEAEAARLKAEAAHAPRAANP
jgi:hypothetical protein